jgi:hypothetical protein
VRENCRSSVLRSRASRGGPYAARAAGQRQAPATACIPPLARSTAQARRHLSKLTREDGQHKRRKKSTRHVQEKTTPLSKPQLRSPGNGAFIRRRVTATETLSQRHKGHGARPLSPEPYSDSAVRARDKAGCCVLLWRR